MTAPTQPEHHTRADSPSDRTAAPGPAAELTARQPQSVTRVFAALVREGLYEQRRTPVTWGVSLGLMCALMVAIWPSIEDTVGTLIKQYPESLKQAFGIVSLDTVEKYVDAEMLSLVVPLAIGFLAVRCVTRPTVSAEERGHLASMLTMPVGRRVLAWSSFVVAAFVVAATLLITWALTMLAGVIVGTGISAAVIGRGMFNVWPLAMAFAGLSVLAAGLVRGAGRVTEISIGILVAMYLLDVVGKLSASASDLRTISAFRYYGSAINEGLDLTHVVGLVGAALLLAAAGAEAFERRDIG